MATQSRAPTSDFATGGTVAYSSGTVGWSLVNDYPDTADPLTSYVTLGTTANSFIVYNFTAFSIPTGSTAISVAVEYTDEEPASGANTSDGRLRVNGTYYNSGTTHNPSTTTTSRSKTFATNPNTAAAWTVDDINGTGAAPLQGFGVIGPDSNPVHRHGSIQLTVTYTPPGIPDENSDVWFDSHSHSAARSFFAGAALALSTAVSIAGGFNHQDDPDRGARGAEANPSSAFSPRKLETTTFIQWGTNDEIPSAAAPTIEDPIDDWSPPILAQPPPIVNIWTTPDEWPTPAAASLFEENESWTPPTVIPVLPFLPNLSFSDDQIQRIQVDDADYWTAPWPVVNTTIQPLVWVDEEIVPQPPATLGTDEEPQPVVVPGLLSPLVTLWNLPDEWPTPVAPSFPAEDDPWPGFQRLADGITSMVYVGGDGAIPGLGVDEDYHWKPQTYIVAPVPWVWYANDEIVPAAVAPSMGGGVLRESVNIISWHQPDEFPEFAPPTFPPDEGEFRPTYAEQVPLGSLWTHSDEVERIQVEETDPWPWVIWPQTTSRAFESNDDIVPQPAAFVSEDEWFAPAAPLVPPFNLVFSQQDTVELLQVEETDPWPRVIWPATTSLPFTDDDQIVPQPPATVQFDEEYVLTFPVPVPPIVWYPPVDEEFPELVTPPEPPAPPAAEQKPAGKSKKYHKRERYIARYKDEYYQFASLEELEAFVAAKKAEEKVLPKRQRTAIKISLSPDFREEIQDDIEIPNRIQAMPVPAAMAQIRRIDHLFERMLARIREDELDDEETLLWLL